MKKILALTVFIVVILTNHAHAQAKGKFKSVIDPNAKSPDDPIFWLHMNPGGNGTKRQVAELVFKTEKINEGVNTVTVAKLKGTLSFVKKGNNYAALVFTDSTGKTKTAKLSGTSSRQTTITIDL